MYDFKIDVTEALGQTGESYLTYPGDLLRDWMAAKRAEFADFEAKKVEYDAAVAEYEAWWANGTDYWNAYRIAQGLAEAASGTATRPSYPEAPQRPAPYTGPKVGLEKGDLTFEAGYGRLTAGTLSVSGGGKSFGVKGQGNPLFAGTSGEYPDEVDIYSAAMHGVKYPAEIEGFCVPSYMAVTVLPLKEFSGSLVVSLTTKGYEWAEDGVVAPVLPDDIPAGMQPVVDIEACRWEDVCHV